MKIYDHPQAPNPRRVRIFLAEKGIQVPYVTVDLFSGENRKPDFLKKNPMGGLPVLELDDGTCIAESIAICRYFEAQKPNPPLFGSKGHDDALVEMWQRRMELNLLGNVGRYFQNTSEMFKARIPQFPDYAKFCGESATRQMEFLDGELAKRKFVAGDSYTVADITALVSIDFGKFAGLTPPSSLKNLDRWHQEVSSRPSARA